MKYLKTYNQLLESQDLQGLLGQISSVLTDQLIQQTTFPGLFKKDEDAWAHIIAGAEWSEYENPQKSQISEEEYNKYLHEYQEENPEPKPFDDFVAWATGNWSTIDPEEDLPPSSSTPLKFYQDYFSVSLETAYIIKALLDARAGDLSPDIGWTKI